MDADKLFQVFPPKEKLMNIIRHTSSTVWGNELVVNDIENWLNNFTGKMFDFEHERLLALWLLSHFTYYNHEEVKHLCKVLYRDLIHKVMSGPNIDNLGPEDLVKRFFEKSAIIPSEETSGSGGFIAFFFRHENDLPMTLFNFSLENVNERTENIIVIDDVTLSKGEMGQMHSFWANAKKKHPSKQFYLLTLVASESSLNYLTSTFGIQIVSAIRLDNRDKCFQVESDVFSSFRESPEHSEIINLSQRFAEHYGKQIGIQNLHPLGYANGQYTFGFFYNTPDNSLPIFWGQINGWVPILRRYHKKYLPQTYLQNERFI